jgi:hypothetical protein
LEEGEPYFGTKTVEPFALILTILASVSVGLYDRELGSWKTMHIVENER